MKKSILSLLACMCICVGGQSLQAQNNAGDFNTLLASFAQVQGLQRILATDMVKNITPSSKLNDALAYEFLWNKDVYLKPENCNSYPIAYYKMGGIVVVLFANLALDRKDEYQINIQTYQKGKFISKRRGLISFKADLSEAYDIYISKNKQSLILKKVSKGKKLEYEQKIKPNGQIVGSN